MFLCGFIIIFYEFYYQKSLNKFNKKNFLKQIKLQEIPLLKSLFIFYTYLCDMPNEKFVAVQ